MGAIDELSDKLMCEATILCCIVHLDDNSWTQASLPLQFRGIGVRRMVDVAVPTSIGTAALAAEERQHQRYAVFTYCYDFVPLALTSLF